MPYSIFFDGGYAIHGSYEISHLGRPASHGCVRLAKENAAVLFELVKEQGLKATRVVLTGKIPDNNVGTIAREEPALTYDDDQTGAAKPQRTRNSRGWREYSNGPNYYYYREAPPRRYYGARGLFPFGW